LVAATTRAREDAQRLALLQDQAPWLKWTAKCTATSPWTAPRACTDAAQHLSGDANLLVLPNIDAANISYNLLKTAAGGNIAIGRCCWERPSRCIS
jgi:malate dehydrogenase (oxaloacetate-decarboxylating)(NADP+)